MKKKIILKLLLVFTISFYSQEKIGNKVYLYGNLESSINGKTLLFYGVEDPKGENGILKRFKDKGVNVISWNKIFLPGYKYSDSERSEKIFENKIQTIVLVKLNGTSTYNQSFSNTTYNKWTNSLNTSGSSGKVVGNVELLFEIYTARNGFEKPVAIVNGNANNSWGAMGSQRGVTLKIVDRVLNSMKKNKAFLEGSFETEVVNEKNFGEIAYELYEKGKFSEAIQNCTKQFEINKDDKDILFLRAICKTELKDNYGAINDYNEIIEITKRNKDSNYDLATAYNNKAYCLLQLKNYTESLKEINIALNLDKSKFYIWDTRGEIYYNMEQYENSIKDMTKAIELEKNPNSFIIRGLSNLKLDNKSKACSDFSKAGELGESKAYENISKYCN